jgi:hypothetical protein
MEINGKPVLNAKKPHKIEIKQVDITKASPKDPGACAAARAILREGTCLAARVHLDRTYIEHEKHWTRFRTPESLRNEIIAIDRGGAFYPGTHELKVLSKSAQEALEKGRRQGTTKGDDKRDSRRKIQVRPRHTIEGVRSKGANK